MKGEEEGCRGGVVKGEKGKWWRVWRGGMEGEEGG